MYVDIALHVLKETRNRYRVAMLKRIGLAFRTFVRFALVWFSLFPLPLGVWEGLRLVIVALPGLFSYLFGNCISYIEAQIYINTIPIDADRQVERD